MLASSFLDPVLGLDIHFEMVPTPAPVPLPIPNPFIGLVFDPIGLAAGIAIGAAIGAVVGAPFQGPVLYWTAFPATNTGTEAKHVPGHILIPPGTAWAPFPKTPKPVIHPGETPSPGLPVKPENDAVVVFGSKTVTVMGSNAVRLGDIALSCSEPLRLPSSVVLAVPKGAPILIGGPMSLDIMSAIMASLRTRFVSDSLHALVSRLKPSRFRNFLHRAVCFFTGHPVDVASGKVMTEFVDIALPGPLPLEVRRIYSSAFASREGPLGHGWSLSLDQAVWRERGKVVLLAEDGRELEFDTFHFPKHRIEPGQEVYDPVQRLTLRCEKNEAWRVVDHEGVVREFAPVPGRGDGRAMIQKIRSRCGYHEITYHYGHGGGHGGGNEGAARGRLEWVRDSGGRFLHLRYDAKGRVTELHLPQPQGEGFYLHRRFEYDAAGDLVRVTDSLGHAWKFAYVTHLLTQETDRNGLSFYFLYDGVGEDAWCVRTWGDGGIYDHVLAYDKRKKITYVTNSLGHVTQYHMNVVGQVVRIVDPLGGETKYEYDARTLQRTKEVDPLGCEIVTTHDIKGNLTSRRAPDGSLAQVSHDEHGRPTVAQSEIGATWRWTYDERGQLIRQVAPDQAQRRYFHSQGLLDGVLDERGQRTSITYTDRKQPRTFSVAGVLLEQWTYDALGRRTSIGDHRPRLRTMKHDLEGRIVDVVSIDGAHTVIEYDAEGSVIKLADQAGETRLTYTGRGRLRSRTRANVTVSYDYDTEQRLTAVIDPLGRSYRLRLDERGCVVEEQDFDSHRHGYVRDARGLVVAHVRPSGRRSGYAYDPCGRVVRVDHGDGEIETFVYRGDGRLIEASNRDRSVEIRRDVMGRVIGEQQGECLVESQYDQAGMRIAMRSSYGLRTWMRRDAMGNVTHMTVDPGTHVSREIGLSHDAEGLELSRTLPGGIFTHWERDAAGRPTRHVSWSSQAIVHDVHYSWAAGDRLQAIADVGHKESTFEHDAAGALVRTVTDSTAILRTRDPVGNLYRTETRQDREYGKQGQLLSTLSAKGSTRYHYDEDGLLIRRKDPSGDEWRYEYDGAARLKVVHRPDGNTVTFSYDAFGRRVGKRTSERELHWYWDGQVLLHEQEPEKAPISWIFDADGVAPVARASDDDFLAVVTDHRGTPLAMLDEHGRLRWEGRVDPEGLLEVSRNEVPCPFRHPGQYHDEETGLSYNRFRYYDPISAQYISPDPVRCIGGLLMAPYIRRGEFGRHSIQDLTSTTSLYGYVEDPLVWIDPFGLVRIHTEGGVEVNAYPGPPAGGIDHKPLHVHVNEAGERETRVLMEDWVDNGRVKGRMGEVYPGDPALSKRAKKVIKRHLDDLARKTDEVFHTGSCK